MAETSIKVIKFSGKKQDWITWQVKHLARASRKGYRDVLDGTLKIPTATEEALLDPSKDTDKIKLVAKNKEAYSDLVLSMMDGTPMVMYHSKSCDKQCRLIIRMEMQRMQ
jgi:hypothetical protein